MSVDPLAATSGVFRIGLFGKDLYEALTPGFNNASNRIKDLDRLTNQYREALEELQSIQKKEGKTHEGLDGFRQTLKECEHILESYDSLMNGKPFGEKPKLSPKVLKESVVYLWDEKDLAKLKLTISTQTTTMIAMTNEILLKKFVESTGARTLNPGHTEEGGNLGQTQHKTLPEPEPLGLARVSQKDVEKLYDKVERIENWLKRTQIPNSMQTSQVDVLEDLRERLLRNEPQSSATDLHELQFANENELLEFSQEKLKRLLSAPYIKAAPTALRCIHVYPPIYPPDSEPFSLPPPAIPDPDTLNSPSIFIPETGLPRFKLHSIDIVTDGRMRYVACTEETSKIGIIHHLPRISNLYPYTFHREENLKHHNKKVSFTESFTVEVTIDGNGSFSNVTPEYLFDQQKDMAAFQSALRGRSLTHTFDVDAVKSKTAELASSTHLKVWTDGDGVQSLSFYGNILDPMQFLEFEISWFETMEPKAQKKRKTLFLHFRLPPKTKKETRKISFSRKRTSLQVSPDEQASNRSSSRLSMVSEACSMDIARESSLPGMRELGPSYQYLEIEFSDYKGKDKFEKFFKEKYRSMNLQTESTPVLPVLQSSPSLRESVHSYFHDTPRSTFGSPPDLGSISPSTSPETIYSFTESFASSNATIRSAPSFTTSAPSEYSRRASSIFNRARNCD